jgi:peptidoglycan/xylan/chitin deacetylase (PgdA/CDA1 family)
MKSIFWWMVPSAALVFFTCAKPGPNPPTKSMTTPESAPVKQIAITIDDLPWAGGLLPNDTREAATKRLLATLTKYNTRAFGFVTCKNISEGEELLSLWLQAGFSLGNHTQSHRAIDNMPLDEWLTDVTICEEKITAITKTKPVWFRYPQLRMGKTIELRDQGREALSKMGYKIAHVTVDTSEWLLTNAYQKALMAAVHHYEEVAQEKLGRSMPQVLLLHANALAADHLGVVLDALQREGYEFISFEEAMNDPAYELSDDYAGVWGVSWLNRIAPVAVDAAEWDKQEIAKIKARFGIE